MARLGSLREAAAIVAGIAIRPCCGALFLLVLTWQLGFGTAGIAGAFAMGLGVATVMLAVAPGAVLLREGALAGFAEGCFARVVAPGLELGAGLLVVAVALPLMLRAL